MRLDHMASRLVEAVAFAGEVEVVRVELEAHLLGG